MYNVTQSLELNPDGTVTLVIDAATVLLRRPKLKQYRAFVESLERVRTKLRAEIGVAAKSAEAAEKAKDAGEPVPDTVDVSVTRGNELMLSWLNEVLHGNHEADGLCPDAPAVNDDTAEVWMTTPSFSNDLIQHWTSRPGARGAP